MRPQAVAASLAAFVVAYFLLFGAGTYYILRLMNRAPQPHEPGLPEREPVRAAGVMPGAAQDLPGTDPHPI